MANVQIPREAVEIGARALIPATWDETPPVIQHMMREQAVTVLNAAAPHIVVAAVLDLAKQARELTIGECCCGPEPGQTCRACSEPDEVADWLHNIATEIAAAQT